MSELRLDDLQFESLMIYQDPKGYCFTSDSVLLANYVKCKKGAKIVEFCAGTGIISILLSKKQNPSTIHAFEINKKYNDMFQKSIEYNKLENKVFAINKPLSQAVKTLGVGYADVVVCNPPYFPLTEEVAEPTDNMISTIEISTNLAEVVGEAKKLLKYGGKFYMVHRVDRMVDILCELRKNNLEPKRITIIYPKPEAVPVVFLVEAHSGGKSGVKFDKVTYANSLNKA